MCEACHLSYAVKWIIRKEIKAALKVATGNHFLADKIQTLDAIFTLLSDKLRA